MRVMVVDDERDIEPLFRQRFKREMREGLVDFHFTFSGEEALAYLGTANAADVVLILSDINMPGINGIELLRMLKEHHAHLKVFMITAYDDREKHAKAVAYGADGYLTKPLDFDRLKTAILGISGQSER